MLLPLAACAYYLSPALSNYTRDVATTTATSGAIPIETVASAAS